MLRKASRRTVLRTLLALTSAAGVGGCGPTAPPTPGAADDDPGPGPPATTIAAMLRAEFAYLDLTQIDLDAFGREFRARGDRKVLTAWDSDAEQFAYALNTQFLMSTDFFWNDADERRPLQYRRYFDLYDGCQSPFAQLG